MFINTRKTKAKAALVIAVAVVVAGLTFLLPVAASVQNPAAAHMRTAMATLAAMLTIAAGVWFLRGLNGFTEQSRKAYLLISVGLAIFSIALLQIPVVGMFDLWQSFWTTSGAALLPFLLPFLLVYLGLRIFTKLLDVRSVINSIWVTLLITASLVGLTVGVGPAFVQVDNPQTVAVSLGLIMWGVSYTAFSLYLAHLVRGNIGQYYKKAILHLEAALACVLFSGLHEYSASFFLTNGDPYADYGWYIWPWVVSGLFLLWASYQFRILTLPLGQTVSRLQVTDSDYVDSIVTVASLASSPKEIDGILDGLRAITSRSGKQGFSEPEKKQLMSVYAQLESYFMRNADPLRSLTKQQLRQHITPGFRVLLEHS